MLTTACSFSQIIIIESLEDGEDRTGQHLSEYLNALVTDHELDLEVVLYQCDHKFEFIELLRGIRLHIERTGEIPLLHVECHGDAVSGLEFANGSELSWEELSTELLALNIATRFNLFAAFAACYGAYFLGRMGAIDQAPCWGIVAPTLKVWPDELRRGFWMFYRELLLSRSTARALSGLRAERLYMGRWLSQTAEQWFETVLMGYVADKCNRTVGLQRVRRLYRQLVREGHRKSVGFLKRRIRRHNRDTLLERYFHKYFLLADVPENARRFDATKRRLQHWISSIENRRRYLV